MRSLKSQIVRYGRVQWTLAFALALGLTAFYAVGYRPTTRQLDGLTLEIQTKQRDLAQTRFRVRDLPILAAQVQQLEGQVQFFDRQLPREPSLDRFIKDITGVSQELALRDWKFSPGAPVRAENHVEMPIAMQFTGDFLSASAFVRRIEDLQRLTRVKKLNIRTKDSRSGQVEVDMSVSIYFSEG